MSASLTEKTTAIDAACGVARPPPAGGSESI